MRNQYQENCQEARKDLCQVGALIASISKITSLISIYYMKMSQWYNGVVSYLWPYNTSTQSIKEQNQNNQMPHLARLKRLRTLLQDSNYKQIHREQICLFYSQLIRQYTQSRVTFQFPKFLYEPEIYTMKIFFMIPLIIKTDQIKGVLELFIMFPEEMNNELPYFFIKNPDYNKFKPNKKCVAFGLNQQQKPFQAILGGLRVKLPRQSKQRWQWTTSSYYKEQNIVNMVRYIHKHLLLDCFPFLARKKQKVDSLVNEAKGLRDFMRYVYPTQQANKSPLLTNIQDLVVLETSIDMEINSMFQQNQELKQIAIELEKANIKDFMPVIADLRSQHLLQSAANLQALRDTICLLENKFYSNEITLQQFQRQVGPYISQQFDERLRVSFYQPPELL